MDTPFSPQEKQRIFEGIRGKYAQVAQSPRGLFRFPTGREGLQALGYPAQFLACLPGPVLESYCGVGNPFSLGPVARGEEVLDIGCGGGVDTLLAALMAGPQGRACGVEPVPEMFARARANLEASGLSNAAFHQAPAEKLPFPDEAFDLVISNGALNLVPDKARALAEAWRVLRPGGRLQVADQVLSGPGFPDKEAAISCWFRWQGGAIPGRDFLAMIEQAGFTEARDQGPSGVSSSPVTEGRYFSALKPGAPGKA